MKLGANAVEFVFHINRHSRSDCCIITGFTREACPDGLSRRLRTREHAFDRTEQGQLRALQLAFQCEQRRFSDVSEKHVRFLHLLQWNIESGCDGFFDETLAQTDSKVTGQYLDHILPFTRRYFRKAGLEKFRLP